MFSLLERVVKVYGLLGLILIYTSGLLAQPLSGLKTVGPSGTYVSLTAAILDINVNGVNAPVILELQSGYLSSVEPGYPTVSISLPTHITINASNNITIRPAVSGIVITADFNNPTLNFSSSKYITIDGRVGGFGSTKDLVVQNINTGLSANAVQFINDGSYNTIKYCYIKGSNPSGSNGVIAFMTTAFTTGNDNNMIQFCDIYNSISGSPRIGIYSSGTAGAENSSNTVSNCNIYDYFYDSGASPDMSGIKLSDNSLSWNIIANSFYQTVDRIAASGSTNYMYGVYSTTTSSTLNIKNNYFGGKSPNCGGLPLSYSGYSAYRGIRLTTGSGVSSIQGNTIQNISLTSISGATANAGISLVTGSFYCGDTIPNLIGSMTSAGSISFNGSAAGAAISGILAGTGSTGTIVIKNNQIGGIAVSSSGSGTTYLRGISVLSAPIGSIISGNIVGSPSAPLSNSTNNTLFGIYSAATAANQEISNNIISYLVTTSTSTANQLVGINTPGGAGSNFIVRGNSITNLTSSSTGTGTTTTTAVVGIFNTASTTAGQLISNNIIHSLSNTAPTQAVNIAGIYYSGPATGSNVISGNFIHSISSSTTSNLAAHYGINIIQGNATSGTLKVYNNMIRLGIDATGVSNTQSNYVVGIRKANGIASFVHNSVYIGGLGVVSGIANSAAFQVTSGSPADSLVNNILYNARTNASTGGTHWACSWGAPTSAICNYNIYYTNGSLSIGSVNGGTSNVGWPYSGQDVNSIFANPMFIAPIANSSSVNLHVQFPTQAESSGLNVPYITDDYDGQIRSGLTPVDIGADAGNFSPCLVGPGPIYVGLSHLYTNLTGPSGLFNAINTVGICGNMSIIIDSDLSEPGTVSLNEWTGTATLTIQSDGTLRTVANMGNVGNPMIHLSGADRVTFNGGTSKLLRFRNTNTLASSTTAVFQFSSSSTQCALQNIEIQSNASTATHAGIVVSTGSNQVSVDQCNIHDATAASVGAIATGIYSNSITNSVSITSSNIYNWSGYGIYFNQVGNGCAITNNHFYYNMVTPANTNQTAIYLGSGNNQNINNNSIGGSGIFASGSPWQNDGSVTFKGIYLNLGVTQLSVIDNNRIQNINLSNTGTVNFEGMHLYSGYAYLGYSIGNTIGHATNAGSITIAGTSGNVYGIHDESTSDYTGIEKNTIANIEFSGVIGSPVFAGIHTKTAYVRRNRIFSIDVANSTLSPVISGISMNSTSGVSVAVSITNNMISLNGGNALNPTIYGYYDNGSPFTGLNFYFNTINIYGSATTSSSTYAYFRNGSAITELYDNILVNIKPSGGTGKHYSIAVQNGAAQWIADYNDFFAVSGTLGRWNGGDVLTLSSWKTISTEDVHSLYYMPVFISNTDLHLDAVGNCAINGKGTYLASVMIDFDNTGRSNPPDIGADEFVGPEITPPTSGGNQTACAGGTIPNLSATGTGTIKWFSDAGLTIVVHRGSPFASGQTAAGVYTYYATDSLSGCESNSITITLTLYSQPTASASATPSSLCSGATIQLNASASGGSGVGYTYSWSGPNSFSSTSQNPTIPNAQLVNTGTYSLSVSDGNSCNSNTPSTVVVTVNAHPTANASVAVSPLCSGSTIQLNGSGGTIYSWSGPAGYSSGAQNPSISNVTTANSGLYSLYVNDANGCISLTPGTVNVLVNAKPVATASALQTSVCIGSSINLTGTSSGGSGSGYSYSWTGPNSFSSTAQNPTISGAAVLNSGIYHLVVTDGNTCISAESQVIITVNTLPVASASAVPTSVCLGSPFNLAGGVTGGSGFGYTWLWSGPNAFSSTFQNPSIASAQLSHTGTYSLVVTDNSGCVSINTTTVSVLVNSLPVAAASGSSTSVCPGSTINLTGSASLGSGSGYTYHWSGPNGFTSLLQNPSILNATSANAGVYSLYVSDGNNCNSTNSAAVLIILYSNPTAIAGSTQSSYCTGSNIQLTGSGSGGSGSGYTYQWSGPSGFTSTLQNPVIAGASSSNAGIYHLTITDGNGCTSINNAAIGVLVNSVPTAVANTSTPTICIGSTINFNGSSSGGSGSGYTYLWTGPNGFTSLLQNPSIINGQTINGGTYSLTVTDGSGCISTNSATTGVIVNAPPVAAASSVQSAVCAGQSISLLGNASSGSGSGYTFSWTGPNGFTSSQQNPTITNAQAAVNGTYTLVVTDSHSCSSTNSATVTINVKELPTATANSAPTTLCEGSPIQLNGNALGGSGSGYLYNWSGPNGFTTGIQNPAILNAQTNNSGIFSLTVTDGNGCASTNNASVTISVYSKPTASASAVPNPLCVGSNLQLTGGASGGSGIGYTYSWTGPNGYSSSVQSPLISTIQATQTGSYSLAVTDNHGCVSAPAASVFVMVNGLPTSTATATQNNLCSGGNLQLNGQGIGGSGTGYIYQWTGPSSFTSSQQNPFISGATLSNAGTYTLQVTDGLGCVAAPFQSVTITVNSVPLANAGNDVTIANGAFTTLTGSASGGSGNYSYAWTPVAFINGSATQALIQTINLSSTQTYSLIVTDATTLCVSSVDQVVVTISGQTLAISATAASTSICENSTVQLNAPASGGSGSYAFNWSSVPAGFSSSQQNPIVIPAGNTTYSVTVNDGFNTATSAINITVNSRPTAGAGVVVNPICAGQALQLNSTATGGSGTGYTFLWAGPLSYSSNQQNPQIANVQTTNAGNYLVTVTDGNGCASQNTAYIPVLVNATPSAYAGPDQTIFFGTSTTLTGSANGSSGPFSYLWSPANKINGSVINSTVQTISLNATQIYTLIVTDNITACVSQQDPVIVNITGSPLTVNSSASPTQICLGVNSTLNAQASGGSGSYTYSWSSAPAGFSSTQQSPVVSPTQTTVYTVTVSDGFTTNTSSVTLTIFQRPVAAVSALQTVLCSGSNIQLQGGASGGSGNGFIFQWNGPSSFTSGLQNPIISNAQTSNSGSYGLIVTDDRGCSSVNNPIVNITINSRPTASPAVNNASLCQGGAFQLSGSGNGGSGSGYTYQWSGPNSFSSTNQNPSFTNAQIGQSGNYFLTVTDGNGCSSLSTAFVNVIVHSLPNVLAFATPSSLCSGAAIQFSGSGSGGSGGGYSYAWTGPAGYNTVVSSPTISNAQLSNTGVYNLVVTDGNSCSSQTATVNITVNPIPISNAGPDQSLPNGAYANLNGSATGGSGNYSWTWSPISSINGNPFMQNVVSLNLTTTQIFTLLVTDVTSTCQSQPDNVTITITGNPLAAFVSTTNSTICLGTGTQLNTTALGGTGIYTYAWSSVPSGFSSNLPNPTVSPVATTTYTVVVGDGFNSVTSSQSITVNTIPVAASGAAQTTFCAGQTLNLSSSASGGSGSGYSFQWTGPNGYTSTQQNPSISNAQAVLSGIYSVTATDLYGCSSASSAVTILIHSLPVAVASSPDNSICIGETLSLTANASGGSLTGYTYNWTGPGGFVSNNQNPQITNAQSVIAGLYSLFVIDGNNCMSTSSATVNVTVSNKPIANAGANQVIPSGAYTTLLASASAGSGFYIYAWAPASFINGPSTQALIQTINLSSTQIYTLTVTDLSTACVSLPDDVSVIVSGGPLTASAQVASPTICSGNTTQLNVLASGGTGTYTYSWTSSPAGFSSSSQNPTISPVISTLFIVSINDGYSTVTSSVQVNVNPLPFVAISGPLTAQCAGTTIFFLNTGSPAGGTYSGPGVSGTNFNASVAGAGLHTITYRVTDVNACTNSAVTTVSVNPLPVIYSGSLSSQCVSSVNYLLNNASPAGGTYSGPGVIGNIFNASLAGAGSHIVTYSLSNIYGCSSSANTSIVVYPVPVVSFTTPLATQCQSSTTYALTGGLPSGGTYSGSGVTSSSFNASASGSGIIDIIYQFNDINGCSNSDTNQIFVNPAPSPFPVSGSGVYCESQNGMTVTLSGSQTGVTYQLIKNSASFGSPVNGTGGALVWPSMSSGTYTVSATNVAVSCSSAMPGSVVISMVSLPIAFTVSSPLHYCYGLNGVTITLSGSQPGFTYQLVKDGSYNGTAVAGTGGVLTWTNKLAGTYSVVAFTSLSGCSTTMIGLLTITEDSPIAVTLTPIPASVIINNNLQLNAAFSGGSGTFNTYQWSGSGSVYLTSTSVTNPVFQSPVVSLYDLTFTVTDDHGCNQSAVLQVQATSPVVEPVMPNQQRCGSGTVIMEAFVGAGGNQVEFSLDGVNVSYTDNTSPFLFTTPFIPSNSSITVYARSRNSSSGNTSTWISAVASASVGSNGGVVVGGGNICLGNSTGSLVLQNYTGLVISWERRINGGSWISIPFTGNVFQEIPSTNGIIGYRALVQLDICNPAYSNEVTVTVSPYTNAGVLSVASGMICLGNPTGQITVSGHTGNVLYWEKRLIGGFWSQINSTLTSYSEIPAESGTWEYRAFIQSGDCPALSTSPITIIVVEQGIMGTLTGSGTICFGSSTPTMFISGQLGTITKWQKRLNGGPWNTISTTASFYSEIPSSSGNWEFRVVMQNGTCPEQFSNSVIVTVQPATNGGILNGSANICYGSSTGNLLLSGYTGFIIKWQKKLETGSWIDFYNFSSVFQEIPSSPGTWYYRVLVQSGNCSQAFSSPAIVFVDSPSAGGEVIGGSQICIGSSTGTLTLNSYSGTILKWQKRFNGANWSDINNQSPIFGEVLLQAGTWEYRAITQSGSCPLTYSVIDTVIVLPVSVGGSVTGGSSFCFGGSTNVLTLTGNNGTIVKWQKRLNNGSWIDFTNTTYTYQETPASPGNWEYRAVVKNGSCSQAFSLSTLVIVSPLPVVYVLSGNPYYCENENGITLSLSGSEPNVSYQLIMDGVNFGYPIQGNGLALHWPNMTIGTYKVFANGSSTFCSQAMQGEVSVYQVPIPQVFSIQSYGFDCSGMGGAHVLLDGSENGISYQLYRNGIANGLPLIGTGLNLDWGGLTVGTYQVKATNILTACLTTMAGTSIILPAPVPTPFNVTGGGTVCANSSGVNVGLSSSQLGITYQLYINGYQTATTLTGTGLAISFGSQQIQGTYSVQATNNTSQCINQMNGSATVNIIQAPSVELGPDMNLFYGTSIILSPSVSGGQGPYNYNWTPAAYLSNPIIQNPIASPLDTTTYTLVVTDANNCSSSDIINLNPVLPTGQSAVSGQVLYANTVHTPLHEIPVFLKTVGGTTIAQVTTDATGHFLFPPFPNGTYVLTATSDQTAGGYNSTDALLILKHFVQLQSLTGIWLAAADVDNSHYVNSIDALAVQKRFVGALTAFPAGKWVFEKKTIVFNSGISNENLLGLCFGDVNGSYVPYNKNEKIIQVNELGAIDADKNGMIEIPVFVNGVDELGAISLSLDYDPNLLDIIEVEIPGSENALIYHGEEGQFRISWTSLNSFIIEKGKPTILLKVYKKSENELVNWVSATGEFSDKNGNIADACNLLIPKLKGSKLGNEDLLLQIVPNPASNTTDLQISTDAQSDCRILILDLQGRLLHQELKSFSEKGKHSVTADLSSFSQGIYIVKIQMINKLGVKETIQKLEIVR